MSRIWFEATRPKTLPAAVCPVMVATALAYSLGYFYWRPATLCLVFALLVQIGTNFANDYLDGIKGADSAVRIGPRRAVASGLVDANTMKMAALGVLAAAFCIGLLLIPFGGWWLLIVGVTSVCCAWLYTGGPYPLAYNGLGDVFVILFFGFIAVGCTYYLQSGNMDPSAILLGFASGILINNILVVNNYRDADEDQQSGKRTLVVLLGRRFAAFQYVISCLLAGVLLFPLASRLSNNFVLLAWIPIIVGVFVGINLHKAGGKAAFDTKLKSSAIVLTAFSLLFTAALCLA